jgi:membrane fusion protein (multidrug efflux system)
MEVQGTNSIAVVGSDNHVEMRVVQLGPIFESFRVVEKGVKEGERVVVEGLQKVRGGMKVSPQAGLAGAGEANKEPMATPAGKR